MGITDDINKAIEKDGRTIEQIANGAGMSKGHLSLFIRRIRTVTIPVAERIAAALGYKIKLVRTGRKRNG